MDKMTINMIAGAVLAALLTVVSLNTFVDMFYPTGGPAGPEHAGQGKAPAVKEAAKEEQAPAQAQPEKPLPQLLAAANKDAGAAEVKKCAVCHTFEKDGPNKVGPDLYGIVGRPVGKKEGFAYSPALQSHGGTWDYQFLDCWLKDPKACIPGNKMAFPGIKKDEDRANVIVFLRSLSDNPEPLPQ